MSRPYDARALRSREALRKALLDLVGEKPLDQITIREITERADVSYPVFFRRYATKQELVEDLAAEEIRQLLAFTLPIFEAADRRASVRILCGYVDSHRTLWSALLTGGAAGAMRGEFIRLASEIGHRSRRAEQWLPVELAAPLVVGSLFEIFSWWLKQPDDYPIVNVEAYVEALVIQLMVRPAGMELVQVQRSPLPGDDDASEEL